MLFIYFRSYIFSCPNMKKNVFLNLENPLIQSHPPLIHITRSLNYELQRIYMNPFCTPFLPENICTALHRSREAAK